MGNAGKGVVGLTMFLTTKNIDLADDRAVLPARCS